MARACINLDELINDRLKIFHSAKHERVDTHLTLKEAVKCWPGGRFLLAMIGSGTLTGFCHLVFHNASKDSWCGATVASLSCMKNLPPGPAIVFRSDNIITLKG